jgi:hypothetical protein
VVWPVFQLTAVQVHRIFTAELTAVQRALVREAEQEKQLELEGLAFRPPPLPT